MKEPTEQDLLNELFQLVQRDLRLHNIDVACQPALFALHIGGQAPFWEYQVDKSRLVPGKLSTYAMEIVNKWEAQRG